MEALLDRLLKQPVRQLERAVLLEQILLRLYRFFVSL
jgi:hypothetical protein